LRHLEFVAICGEGLALFDGEDGIGAGGSSPCRGVDSRRLHLALQAVVRVKHGQDCRDHIHVHPRAHDARSGLQPPPTHGIWELCDS